MRSILESAGRCLLCAAGLASLLAADDKPPPAKKPPRVALAHPLAVPTGRTTKVVLRGWELEQVTEVRLSRADVQLKLLGKAKATVPNKQDAKQVGDSQLELELTVAAEPAHGELTLVLAAPETESPPYSLLLGASEPRIDEVESNDGFRQAQPIRVPQVVDGAIHADQNVDVFVFDLAEPQTIVIEAIAQRRGSALDSLLTLYDEHGKIVDSSDDTLGTTDSQIERLLSAGRYFLSLQDAHDRGGPAHPYRLVVRSP
jgi:hypothetical protein